MNSLKTVSSNCVCHIAYMVSSVSYILRNTQYTSRRIATPTKLLLLLVLLSGCGVYRLSVPAADYYYLNPDKDLFAIGRAALVDLGNDSSYPAISTDVTEALFRALQKKQVFGLTLVHQSDPAWRSLQLDLDSGSQMKNSVFGVSSTYTLDQLFAMRKTLKCDAILIGTITGYQPYPHMSIGLRLKLVDLKDGQLLWALEQIWDSTDKTTENRAKRYFGRTIRLGPAPLGERLATVSLLKFIKFVAYEVAETLQPEMQNW